MPKVFSQNIFTDFSAENEVTTFSISERWIQSKLPFFFYLFYEKFCEINGSKIGPNYMSLLFGFKFR